MGQHRIARKAGLAAVLAAAAVLTACGTTSDVQGAADVTKAQQAGTDDLGWKTAAGDKAVATADGNQVSIDVGNGHTLSIDKSKPIKIAFLNQGSSNSYLQANAKGAEAAAKDLGVDLTVFDGGYDAGTQKSQLENVLSGGQYNAIMTLSVDGNGLCQSFTDTAPEKNIPVVTIIQTICNNALDPASKAWSPGTLATVVGGGTLDFYQAWADHVASSVTTPTEAVYVTGPSTISPVQAAVQALKQAEAKYPNFKLVDVKNTDFSSAQALSATQNALLAHPDVKLVLSHFTPMTTGILQALKQSGTKDVKVYDIGGDATAKGYVEAGTIAETVPYYPYTAAYCGVSMLKAAWDGESVPRTVLNDCRPSDSTVEKPTYITKANVADFSPEY